MTDEAAAVDKEQFDAAVAALLEGPQPWMFGGYSDSSGYEEVKVTTDAGADGDAAGDAIYTVGRYWQDQCGWREDVGYGPPRLFKQEEGITAPGLVCLLGQVGKYGYGIVDEFEKLYAKPGVRAYVDAALAEAGAPLPLMEPLVS